MIRITPTLSLVFLVMTSIAQPSCDEVIIESVVLEPIDMEILVVRLTNNNEEFGFSYPGFRIYDENDVLIGEEVVNLFGIAAESTHLVPHNLEDIEFGGLYDLKLELWSGFYETLECTFEGVFEILPNVCSEISLTASLQNFDETPETHNMQVVDQDGLLVFEEEVTLTEGAAYVVQAVCLDPGCYTYKFVPQDGVTNTEVSCWINSVEWFFPEGYMQSSLDVESISIDFAVYSDCLVDVVENEKPLELLIYPNPARERINVSGVPNSGVWSLLNTKGEKVRSGANSGKVEINVEDLASGLYFLKIETGASVHTFQVVR